MIVDPAFESGLDGLFEFSHPVVLAHPDGIEECRFIACPLHDDDLEVGMFATRTPIARIRSPRRSSNCSVARERRSAFADSIWPTGCPSST